MNNFNYDPQQENEEQYIYRICDMKSEIGTWEDVANILNKELSKNYTESKYRKEYQSFQRGMKINEDKIFSDDEYLNEIKKQTDELYKAKKQFYDQRREYNKLLIDDARSEHIMGELVKAANRLNTEKHFDGNSKIINYGTNEAVLVLSDWHFGMTTDNVWNKFNIEICIQRLNELFEQVKPALQLHQINNLHVIVLGDLIHGAIHTTCRIASEEDTCDQLMQASELLADLIDALSSYVNRIEVYTTYGNHARTVANKKENIHSDNMEKIVSWWLSQRFKDLDNIHINDNEYYEFIYCNVLGHGIVASHGDLESFDKMGVDMHTIFSKKYGINVDYVFSGDKHHLDANDSFGIESILVRSLCGTDEYANNKRLYSIPGQTLCIFNKNGKLCTYEITF